MYFARRDKIECNTPLDVVDAEPEPRDMPSHRYVKIPTPLLMVLVVSILLLHSLVSLREEDMFSIELDDVVDGRLVLSSRDHIDSTTFDTRTSSHSSNDNTISIYLHIPPHPNPGYSIFKTDILQRFGSGRFTFVVHESADCGPGDCNHWNQSNVDENMTDNNRTAPCLAVAQHIMGCPYDSLRCSYPSCKTMITNDEMCDISYHDIRAYYSANYPNKGYLPLGPRLDAWSAFQLMRRSPEFFIKPPSTRQYAFNAIFSKSTNTGREHLASILEVESQMGNSTLPIYTAIAEHFNRIHRGQLNPQSYMEVLLDSVFTLTPAGHNPECYRMYEAIEAGSIPVFVTDDLYITEQNMAHPCREALQHWYDAPILVLDSWDMLFPTVERLLDDLAALDEIQTKLSIWYDGFLRRVVREFEDFMLNRQ